MTSVVDTNGSPGNWLEPHVDTGAGLLAGSDLDVRGNSGKLLQAMLATVLLPPSEESTAAELLIGAAGESRLVTSSATLATSWSMTWDGNESAGVSTAVAFIAVEDDGVERLDLFLNCFNWRIAYT